MGPVAPAGVANPARRVLPNRRIGDLLLPSCCSGNALCVKGLAMWQIAWYQQGITCRTSRSTALRGRAACSTWSRRTKADHPSTHNHDLGDGDPLPDAAATVSLIRQNSIAHQVKTRWRWREGVKRRAAALGGMETSAYLYKHTRREAGP
jgi:hypothetical protein